MARSVRTVAGTVLLVAAVAAAAGDDGAGRAQARRGRFRWERDDWFDAQFTGHPKFACAKTGYPRGEKFPGYYRRFLLKTPESPRSLFCTLQGEDSDLQAMIRHVGLNWSTRSLRRGGMIVEVSAPEVRCAARPRLLASLFDLLVVSGRQPRHAAWCLLLQPPPPPHDAYLPRFPQPTGGALAIRFHHIGNIPDVFCSPDVRRKDESEDVNDEDVDFFVQGFLENWTTYFRCKFQRPQNSRGPSVHTLLLSLVLELRLGYGAYRGRPATQLPAHTCREACPDRAPRPGDLLLLTGSYRDDYAVNITMTSPLGRTAICAAPEAASQEDRGPAFQVEVDFPGRVRLVCHSHRVPMGEDVDGTEFYFIVYLDVEFEKAKTFRCKVKHGEQLGGDKAVEASLLALAQETGLRVDRLSVEMGGVVPSVFLGPASCEWAAPPPGYLHHFQVTGDTLPSTRHCAFGMADRRNEPRDQSGPSRGWHSDTRIY